MRAIALTHVFPRWDGDPSAAFLSTWAAALRADGHDVRVIAPHDAGLPEVDVIEDTPVRFVRYAARSWPTAVRCTASPCTPPAHRWSPR